MIYVSKYNYQNLKRGFLELIYYKLRFSFSTFVRNKCIYVLISHLTQKKTYKIKTSLKSKAQASLKFCQQ